MDLNPLAALIAPLAALALLGAASFVSANPTLLTLAVLNNGKRKKRKRRSEDGNTEVRRRGCRGDQTIPYLLLSLEALKFEKEMEKRG